jgi:hypothetical protein
MTAGVSAGIGPLVASICAPFCDDIDIILSIRNGQPLGNHDSASFSRKFELRTGKVISTRFQLNPKLATQSPFLNKSAKVVNERLVIRQVGNCTRGRLFICLKRSTVVDKVVEALQLGRVGGYFWAHDLNVSVRGDRKPVEGHDLSIVNVIVFVDQTNRNTDRDIMFG